MVKTSSVLIAVLVALGLGLGSIFWLSQPAEKSAAPQTAAAAPASPAPEAIASTGADDGQKQRASAPRRARKSAVAANPGEALLSLAGDGLSAVGTARDAATGEPVAGAAITLAMSEDHDPLDHEDGVHLTTTKSDAWNTVTNADGHYQLRLPKDAAGELKLTCTAPGYALGTLTVAHSQLAKSPEKPLDFALVPGGSVSGLVRDAESSGGIAGVQVRARLVEGFTPEDYDDFPPQEPVLTDDQGRYTLDYLVPGPHRIMVMSREAGYLPPAMPVVTVKAAQTEQADFTLQAGGAIEGTVRDRQGKPVVDAMVMLETENPLGDGMRMEDIVSRMPSQAMTDVSGQYVLRGVDFDQAGHVEVHSEDFADYRSDPLTIAPAQARIQHDIVLYPGSTVSGMATYADGTPAVGVDVLLSKDGVEGWDFGYFSSGKYETANRSGHFTFEQVGAGGYTLSADPGNAEPGEDAELKLTTDGVRPVENLALVVGDPEPEGGASLTGQVLDAQGTPVPEISVSVSGIAGDYDWESTDDEGRFNFNSLEGDTFALSVADKRGMAVQEGVQPGEEVILRLQPATHLTGTVVDRAGKPVANCRVIVTRPPAQSPEEMEALFTSMMMEVGAATGSAFTDAEGRFDIFALRPGQYLAKARAAEVGTGAAEIFEVTLNQPLEPLHLTLSPGATLSGTVRNTEGEGLPGVELKLKPTAIGIMAQMDFMPDTGQELVTATTAEGAFTFTHVAPGDYALAATHTEYARTLLQPIALAAGQEKGGVALTMSRGGCVTGTPLFGGAPKPGVMVQLMGGDDMRMGTTDAQGRFDICKLAPGRYTVMVMDMSSMQEGMPVMRTAEVADGATVEVDFEPAAGSVPVTGRIGSGAEAGTLSVVLMKEGAPNLFETEPMDMAGAMEMMESMSSFVQVQPDGTFALEDVAPGRYELHVYLEEETASMFTPPEPVHTQPIEVRANAPLELDLKIPSE